MVDEMKIVVEIGKCCYCGGTMQESKFNNQIMLNKKAEWEFPTWDNLLLQGQYEKIKRACSFLCDLCIEKKNNPIFAYSIQDGKIFYHDITRLKDTFEIKEEMLKKE